MLLFPFIDSWRNEFCFMIGVLCFGILYSVLESQILELKSTCSEEGMWGSRVGGDLFVMTQICEGILVRVHTHHNKFARQWWTPEERCITFFSQGVYISLLLQCPAENQKQEHMNHEKSTSKRVIVRWIGNIVWRVHFCFLFLCGRSFGFWFELGDGFRLLLCLSFRRGMDCGFE